MENFKRINWNTKKARGFFRAWCKSNDYALECVYKSYSCKKANAWNYCINLCKECNGRHLVITGYSGFVFSAAFIFGNSGSRYMVYITPTTNYAFNVEPLFAEL